jgi:diguanylate cyclase (GGDEF)-like protein/PAS domain S-box-containing protein
VRIGWPFVWHRERNAIMRALPVDLPDGRWRASMSTKRAPRAHSLHGEPLPEHADAPAPGPTSAVDRLAHELQVQQIELQMQNEELRRAQVELETARDRYQDLYDFAPVGYFTLDAKGLIVEANLRLAEMLGVTRARLIGQLFAHHAEPAQRGHWQQYLSAALQQAGPSRIELALRSRDGGSLQAQLDGVRVADAQGAPLLRVTLTDLSERKRADDELRLAAVAFETQEGIMITDEKGVIQRVNHAFSGITGYAAAEAIGRTARLLKSGRHDRAFYAAMWDCLRRTGFWQGEVWNRRKSGELYPQWLTITAVGPGHAGAARYVGTMLDIAQRKSQDEEIAQLAFYDPLTGLPNRRLMKDRLHQALAMSARTQREGALMFIDLDRFKTANDTMGHEKGDLLLQQVAQRLTACVRQGDTVARLGGDEFVVMLAAELSDRPGEAAAQARAVGEKILAALNRPYQLAGHDYHGSASVGVALFQNHQVSMDELLTRADQAMYQAKAAGRNTLRFFDAAIHQLLQQRSATEAQLRRAVQGGELVLHYQPGFDRGGCILGAEALVRWQHPTRGLLLPAEFIGIAEDSGLIHELGRWVLDAACAQLRAWSADPVMARLHLSVNISARQLHDRLFVQQVQQAIARHGADAAHLKLELTESMMLDNIADTIAKMRALKAVGVGFSLDDFGTGYASLTYLKQLPLDQLKIDRSFVQDMLATPSDAAIARSIVELGRNLGLTVIAEGVETLEQRNLLARYGCHVFQGDLFGKPASAEVLQQLVLRSIPAPPAQPARSRPSGSAAPRDGRRGA